MDLVSNQRQHGRTWLRISPYLTELEIMDIVDPLLVDVLHRTKPLVDVRMRLVHVGTPSRGALNVPNGVR